MDVIEDLIMKTLQKILTLFIGIGAVAGTVMMWIDPTGVSWGGEPLLVMLRDKIRCPRLWHYTDALDCP